MVADAEDATSASEATVISLSSSSVPLQIASKFPSLCLIYYVTKLLPLDLSLGSGFNASNNIIRLARVRNSLSVER
jgi:hypothetical protein